MYKSVYLLLTVLVFRTSSVSGHNLLHIGGIFPIGGKGGWQGGQGEFISMAIYDADGAVLVVDKVQYLYTLITISYVCTQHTQPSQSFVFVEAENLLINLHSFIFSLFLQT